MAKTPEPVERKLPLARLARKSFEWMHVFYIVQASLYVVWIGVAAAVALAYDYYSDERLFDLFKSKLFFVYSAVFFFTLSTVSLIILYRFVKDKKATVERYVRMQSKADKNAVIEPLFLTLAYDNAICDTQLFKILFLELYELIPVTSNSGIQVSVAAARGLISGNIRDIANKAQAIFSAHTGRKCAVSIKLVALNSTSPGLSVVQSFLRDSESGSTRGQIADKSYRVDQNTAFREICLGHKQVYVCDDLLDAARLNKYKNPRKWWELDYTATIVTPIYLLDSENVNHNLPQSVAGFLCVDNKGGGFEDSESIRHAKELGWRLSVMLYRYSAIHAPQFAKLVSAENTSTEKVNGRKDNAQ